MSSIRAYVAISRPVNMLIAGFSIVLASLLAGATRHDAWMVALAALTGMLVTAGANAINDVFDIEIDKRNRPSRPLPSGMLTPLAARGFWILSSALALSLNLFTNVLSFVIVLAAWFILYHYSAYLKRTVFYGNAAVALMTALAFIYGGAVIGDTGRSFMPALFAFLATMAREIVKDAEDVEGDTAENATTLAVAYGIKTSRVWATVSVLTLIVSTFLPLQLRLYGEWYIIIVLFADALLLFVVAGLWRDLSRKNLGRMSSLLKIAMVLGLVSMYAGSF